MKIDKELGIQLKKQLPWKSMRKIAKICGCSEKHVSNILSGLRHDNYKVLEEAVKVIKESRVKEKEDKLKTEIQEVLSQ